MLNLSQQSNIGFKWVLEQLSPYTPYGAELVRHPRFYASEEIELLHEEQENVDALMKLISNAPTAFSKLSGLLMPVKDIRRSISRCGEVTLSETELFEIKRFLIQLSLIADEMSSALSSVELKGINIFAIPEALELIDPEGMRSPSFYISDSFSERLRDIRRKRKAVDVELAKGDKSESLYAKRTRLAVEEEDECACIRFDMSMALGKYRDRLLSNADSIGRLDYTLSKAELGLKYSAIIPNVGYGNAFKVFGMVNPMIADTLTDKGGFTPISIELKPGSTVITGANMGGKSVAIKTLALNTMLALCGFPVFAESAEIPSLNEVYLLSEDREDSVNGLSSFGGEMRAFDSVLRETEKSGGYLVLLDEFARGTNPHEGSALIKSAVRLFNTRADSHEDVFAIAATHFDGVAVLSRAHYQVIGLKDADKDALISEMRGMIGTGKASAPGNVLKKYMNYGLCAVSTDEEPPRDAATVCLALGVSDEFMKLIENK